MATESEPFLPSSPPPVIRTGRGRTERSEKRAVERAEKFLSETISPDQVTVVTTGFANSGGGQDKTHDARYNQEKPWHRLAALLYAQGMSAKSIAEYVEKHPNTIENLTKQPAFQQVVLRIIEESGGNDIMALIKAESINSFKTLVELRDDTETSPAIRAKIATDILDRVLGKAVTRVEHSGNISSGDPVEEVQRLQEENDRLKDKVWVVGQN